jgi:hypothetical protein
MSRVKSVLKLLYASFVFVLPPMWFPATARAQEAQLTSVDPLVGVWKLDSSQGENYEYVITVFPDGTTRSRLMGEEFGGAWTRLRKGRYTMSPAGENDYVRLRKGRLEQWDSSGFIRAFKRISS